MNMGSYSCCTNSKVQVQKLETLNNVLKLVAERNRLKLLYSLYKKSQCVCKLAEQISLSQSLISHHLKDLKEAKIVTDKRNGLRVYYSLTKKGKKIINLLFKI